MPAITSNRPIEDWGGGQVLKDNAASSAILDRLLHHGYLLKFEGNSYRLKEATKRLSQKKDEKKKIIEDFERID
jgi:DNA replication protein DnaC